MKIIEIRCPHCGGELHIGEDRKECFCEYCGSKLLFDDGTVTTVQVVRDEARLKELEIEEIKLKSFENKDKAHKKLFKIWLIVFFVYTVSILLLPKGLEGILLRIVEYYIGFGIIAIMFFGLYVLATMPNDKKK